MARLSPLLLAVMMAPATALQRQGPFPPDRMSELQRWMESVTHETQATAKPQVKQAGQMHQAGPRDSTSLHSTGLHDGAQTRLSALQAWFSTAMNSSAVQNNSELKPIFGMLPSVPRAPDFVLQALSPRMVAALNTSDGGVVTTDAHGREKVELMWGVDLVRFRAGDNKTFPVDGDHVSVSYDAFHPDGTPYDSSRERGPLSFEVGAMGNIPGLDLAVKHMSLGARCLVKVPRDLLFPQMPAGPCPDDPLLVFDVTLTRVNGRTAAASGKAH